MFFYPAHNATPSLAISPYSFFLYLLFLLPFPLPSLSFSTQDYNKFISFSHLDYCNSLLTGLSTSTLPSCCLFSTYNQRASLKTYQFMPLLCSESFNSFPLHSAEKPKSSQCVLHDLEPLGTLRPFSYQLLPFLPAPTTKASLLFWNTPS